LVRSLNGYETTPFQHLCVGEGYWIMDGVALTHASEVMPELHCQNNPSWGYT